MMRLYLLFVISVILCAFTYPERVATKQDYINLMRMPKYNARAVAELKELYDNKDEHAVRVVSGSIETEDMVTEKIVNPMPRWKQKGFESREEVLQFIQRYQRANTGKAVRINED